MIITPAYECGPITIYQGRCLDVMRELPSESVNCIVTSPPYWAKRDYGTAEWSGGDENCDHMVRSLTSKSSTLGNWKNGGGQRYAENAGGVPFLGGVCGKCGATRSDDQIGLESTPTEFVDKMVDVFREARRLLASDGTLWMVIGDTYYQGSKGQSGEMSPNYKQSTNRGSLAVRRGEMLAPNRKFVPGLKAKDLVGIPWQVALALRDDGWYLRGDIIWHKTNPYPEPVKDRCTLSHEYVFLLSKSEQYFYDYEAIKEPASGTAHSRGSGVNPKAVAMGEQAYCRQKPSFAAAVKDIVDDRNKRTVWSVDDEAVLLRWLSEHHPEVLDEYIEQSLGKSDMWPVALNSYRGAHFATYPPKLITPCILAGCPEGGTVLDPFSGSGTTGEVARKFGRKYVGIELNAAYIELSKRRLQQMTLFGG